MCPLTDRVLKHYSFWQHFTRFGGPDLDLRMDDGHEKRRKVDLNNIKQVDRPNKCKSAINTRCDVVSVLGSGSETFAFHRQFDELRFSKSVAQQVIGCNDRRACARRARSK